MWLEKQGLRGNIFRIRTRTVWYDEDRIPNLRKDRGRERKRESEG